MPPILAATPWMDHAAREVGVREAPGAANDPRVVGYYRDAGHPEIAADSVPWCAAFACAMLERAGVSSPKNLAARSFLQWGKPLSEPAPGAIVVLTRGDPRAWTGHVGFVWAWDESRVWVLGGNQGDAVSVQPFPRSAVLGYRAPVTPANSRTMQAGRVSVAAGGATIATRAIEAAIPAPDALAQLTEASDAANAVATSLHALSGALPVLGLVAGAVSVLAALVILWARLDDLANKGR